MLQLLPQFLNIVTGKVLIFFLMKGTVQTNQFIKNIDFFEKMLIHLFKVRLLGQIRVHNIGVNVENMQILL